MKSVEHQGGCPNLVPDHSAAVFFSRIVDRLFSRLTEMEEGGLDRGRVLLVKLPVLSDFDNSCLSFNHVVCFRQIPLGERILDIADSLGYVAYLKSAGVRQNAVELWAFRKSVGLSVVV